MRKVGREEERKKRREERRDRRSKRGLKILGLWLWRYAQKHLEKNILLTTFFKKKKRKLKETKSTT